MRVLVTGSNGMLGAHICEELYKKNIVLAGIDLTATSSETSYKCYLGDLTDKSYLSYVLSDFNPDVVIHCAAIVNLNYCEEHQKEALALHKDVCENINTISKGKIRIIFISTDSVFDGNKGNYSENDSTNPLNFYSKSKRLGEIYLQENYKNYLILRTNIYGYISGNGKSLFQWGYNQLKSKNKIKGFTDVIFNPLYTRQLAELIILLLNEIHTGKLNVASSDSISKYAFLGKIATNFGFQKELIEEALIENMNFVIERPNNTVLNTKQLQNIFPDYNLSLEKGFKMLIEDNDLI